MAFDSWNLFFVGDVILGTAAAVMLFVLTGYVGADRKVQAQHAVDAALASTTRRLPDEVVGVVRKAMQASASRRFASAAAMAAALRRARNGGGAAGPV